MASAEIHGSTGSVSLSIVNRKNEAVRVEPLDALPGGPILYYTRLDLTAGNSQGTFPFVFRRGDTPEVGHHAVRLQATPAEGPPAYLDVEVDTTGPQITAVSEVRPPDRLQPGEPLTVFGHGFCSTGSNFPPYLGGFGTPLTSLTFPVPAYSGFADVTRRFEMTSVEPAARGVGRDLTLTSRAGATATFRAPLRSTRNSAFGFESGLGRVDARQYLELFGPEAFYGKGIAEDEIFRLFREATARAIWQSDLGLALGLDRIARGKVMPLSSFTGPLRDASPDTRFFAGRADIPGETRPPVWTLRDFTQIQQLNMFGAEFLTAIFQNQAISPRGPIEKMLREGTLPGLILGGVRGARVLVVHDVEPTSTGYRLYVYDPQVPLTEAELGMPATHEQIETQSFVDVIPGRWTYAPPSVTRQTGTQLTYFDPRVIPVAPHSALKLRRSVRDVSVVILGEYLNLTFDPSTARAAASARVQTWHLGGSSTLTLGPAKTYRVTLKPTASHKQSLTLISGGNVQSLETSDWCPACPNRIAELPKDGGIGYLVPKGRSRVTLTASTRVKGKARLAIAKLTTTEHDTITSVARPPCSSTPAPRRR